MNWLTTLFEIPSAIQAVIIICLICALGLALSKWRIRGISLGVTYVFFFGILAGAAGLKVDSQMLNYAESFGLILFVYTLGLQVGPGFMSTFRKGGTTLNLLALGVVVLGTVLALVPGWTGLLPLPDMMGVLCGATTNTPALGAAQQTLKQCNMPASGAALSCAVTYAFGMVGVIVALLLVKGWLSRHEKASDDNNDDEAFIASFLVCNPAVFGHTLGEISGMDESKFVVSRARLYSPMPTHDSKTATAYLLSRISGRWHSSPYTLVSATKRTGTATMWTGTRSTQNLYRNAYSLRRPTLTDDTWATCNCATATV